MKVVLSKKLRRTILTNFPTQEQIINTVLKGMLQAKENFSFWTNKRLSLSYAPQKILTMYVAQEIGKMKNAPEIFIDASTRDILRCSLENRDIYPEFMKKRQINDNEFAITLDKRFEHKNNNDSISKVIISIRNAVINPKNEYLNKIDNICKILYKDDEFKNSSLEYAIFAFNADLSNIARKRLDKRIPQLIKKFDTIVQSYPNLNSFYKSLDIIKEQNNEEWTIGCYIIENNKK